MAAVSIKQFLGGKTIRAASWTDIAYASWFNVLRGEDLDDNEIVFDKNDHEEVLHYINIKSPSIQVSYRALYDDINGVKTIDSTNTSQRQGVAAMILLLWGWWRRTKISYANKEYIYNNYANGDFYFTDDAIKIIEFMVDVNAFTVFANTNGNNFLHVGPRGKYRDAYGNDRPRVLRPVETEVYQTKGLAKIKIGEKGSNTGASGELQLAKNVLAWYNAATSGNAEVKQDISKMLGNLGFTKKQFFDDTIRYASLLVAGKVVTQKPNPEYLRWKNHTPSMVKVQQIKHGSNPPESVSFSYPVYHDPDKLYNHRINDVDSKSQSALRVGDWVSSDVGDHNLQADGDAQNFDYRHQMYWMGLTSNGADRYEFVSQSDPGDASNDIKATVVYKVREVTWGNTQLVRVGLGNKGMLPPGNEFNTSVTKFKGLVDGIRKLYMSQKNGPSYTTQPDGIPSDITTLQQLNNFYKGVRDKWWDSVQVWLWNDDATDVNLDDEFDETSVRGKLRFSQYSNSSDPRRESNTVGPIDGIAPIENCWSRLLHILANTESEGTPADILKSQNDYGLTNINAKTELQLYDEALGSAAYVTAGLFLYWSALAELADAQSAIIKALDDFLNIDTTAEDIINKAKNADVAAAETLSGDPPEEAETELTEEQIEKLQIFLKQCALLLNMNSLKEAYQKEFTKKDNPNTYGDLIHTIDSNNADTRTNLITKLSAAPTEKIETFLRMTPEIQSALVPKLRFFKVYNTDKEIKEVEFSFPRHYDPNDTRYFLNTDGNVFRGGGSGIKSFSFSFEGTTPATARNDIKADLVLFFQDFKDLTKKRKTDSLFDVDEGKGEEFSYIELLLLPGTRLKGAMSAGNKYESHFNSFDASEHRIRVDVGWTVRDDKLFTKIIKERGFLKKVKGAAGEKPSYINKVKEAINLINKSYYLNMVDHNIDFQEDGSVEITVNYRAYFETISKSSSLDALLTPELARERIALGKEYETIISDDKLCSDPKEFEQLIRTYEALESRYVKKSHQSIIERLIKRNKLHYCIIERTSVEEFRRNGYFPSTPTLVGSGNIQSLNLNPDVDVAIETVTDEEDPKAAVEVDVFHDSELVNLEGYDLGPATEDGFVTFFYFGDLIHVVLDCLKDPFDPDGSVLPHLNKNKIILSSFNYLDNANRSRNLNLSEVPISTEYFFEWMNQNVIKPKRKSYPLTYFIRDLCNKLVVDLLLEQCINRSPMKTLSFKTLNLIGKGKYDPFITMDKIEKTNHFDVTKAYSEGKLPLESNIGDGTLNDAFNFIVIYPVTEIINHTGRGNYTEDGKGGVYHFVLGQNDGIVKTMKFNKTDIQGMREARFFNHGHDGLMQLSAVYKVTLEMFGNTIFYPGMYIFIDPRGIGGNEFDPTSPGTIANSLGLGGYHLVTRVESTVGPGQFDTTVEAQFVYAGDGKDGIFKRKYNEPLKDTNISGTPFSGGSVDNACTKIALYRQGSLENIGVSDNQPMNLAAAANAGVLDNVVEGRLTTDVSNPLLSEEDYVKQQVRQNRAVTQQGAAALGLPVVQTPVAAPAPEADDDDHHK